MFFMYKLHLNKNKRFNKIVVCAHRDVSPGRVVMCN